MNAPMNAVDLMNALSAELMFVPVDPTQVVDGAPTTGETAIAELGAAAIGVWEMSSGAMSDTEVAEVSVVIAGSASIQLVDEGRVLAVGPGDVIRFAGGERTIWRVADRVRKVYVVEAD